MNIFVPTKNRTDNCSFIKMAVAEGTPITLVVEPQDYENYIKLYPTLNYVILPLNNMGITYARNYIKNFAEENKLPNYWVVDDDINGVFKREGTKLIRDSVATIFSLAEQQLKNYTLGALEYRQLAWSASKPLIENTFCDSCVFVNTNLLKPLTYNADCKEDRDMAIQVIRSGLKTARTTLYAFNAPANGSNKGGLKEIYYDINGLEEKYVDNMIARWGNDICTKIVKPTGRIDVKINWKNINSKQQSLF